MSFFLDESIILEDLIILKGVMGPKWLKMCQDISLAEFTGLVIAIMLTSQGHGFHFGSKNQNLTHFKVPAVRPKKEAHRPSQAGHCM